MRIGILGYGSVGKSIHSIYKNLECELVIVSSKKYIKDIQSSADLTVYDLEDSIKLDIPKCDVLIICTKVEKIQKYIDIINNLKNKNCLILPIQNGFYGYELLSEKFGNNVIASSISIVAKKTEKNLSVNLTKKPIFSLAFNKNSEYVHEINNLIHLSRNVIEFELIDSNQELLWRKFTRIISLSTSCIYFQNNLGQILTDKNKLNFLIKTLKSMKVLSNAYGVKIDVDMELKRILNISPKLITSLYESLENKDTGEFNFLILEAIKRAELKNVDLANVIQARDKIYARYPWIINN